MAFWKHEYAVACDGDEYEWLESRAEAIALAKSDALKNPSGEYTVVKITRHYDDRETIFPANEED